MSGTPAVEIERLTYAYPGAPGGAAALRDISLRIEQGEMLGILGPNGGGKSTLLKIMLGLISGFSGRVLVGGMPAREAARRGVIGYLPQRAAADLTFPVSARQVVEMGASCGVPAWRGLSTDERAQVRQSIDLVGAAAYADRPVGTLSGGQLQRVLIARALARRPRVLALDEPTVGVDAVGQQQFAELLRRLHRELGLTIIIVSHDLRTVATGAGGCDRVACLRQTLHFHAAPQGVTPQVLAEVFQHDLAGLFGDVHVDAHRAADCGHDHSHPVSAGGAAVALGVSAKPATDSPPARSDDERAG